MIQGPQMGLMLVVFYAVSQVVQADLPLLPFNLEEVGVIACTLLTLALGLRIRFSGLLLALAAVEFSVYALNPMVNGDFGGVARAGLKSAILFLALSIFREMFLRDERGSLRLLARAWVALAAVSAVIILLQFVGALPNYVLAEGQLLIKSRPSGLQNDPNYAAFSLAGAIVMLRMTDFSTAARGALAALLLVALVATESRMGVILLAIVYLYLWFPKTTTFSRRDVLNRAVATLGATALVGLLFAVLVMGQETTGAFGGFFLLERFVQAAEALDGSSLDQLQASRGYQTDSARERMMLAFAGWEIWQRNFWFGVGDGLVREIFQLVRVEKATHNAYIDRLAIGGVAGLAFVVFVLHLVVRAVVSVGGAEPATREAAVAFLIMAVVGGLFLNTSFWLPVAMLSVCFSQPRRRGARAEAPPATGTAPA